MSRESGDSGTTGCGVDQLAPKLCFDCRLPASGVASVAWSSPRSPSCPHAGKAGSPGAQANSIHVIPTIPRARGPKPQGACAQRPAEPSMLDLRL